MFNSNKKKLDSRVRFQNQGFQKQLDKQRNYKRGKRTFPQTDWGVFLSKIGLSSIKTRLFVLTILFLLVYLVYIPNFLFIKIIQINGIAQPKRAEVQKVVESYLSQKLPWPQKNLILLSTTGLENYVLKNNQSILKIDKITKSYFNTLIINVTPRQDTFVIESKNGSFGVANDGLITKIIYTDSSATTTLPSALVLIKLTSDESLYVGQHVLSSETASSLKQFFDQFPEIIKTPVSYFEINSLNEADITAITKNKFQIKFNIKTDPLELIRRLKLLVSQFSDTEIASLEYIDMRYEDRGYVCHKNQPCVAEVKLPSQNTASSSPENLNPN
ncbi:MAG: hypothetical protein WC794_00790 [Candidatus Doudnabacteria bacterium]|jgi:hypothetical protein